MIAALKSPGIGLPASDRERVAFIDRSGLDAIYVSVHLDDDDVFSLWFGLVRSMAPPAIGTNAIYTPSELQGLLRVYIGLARVSPHAVRLAFGACMWVAGFAALARYDSRLIVNRIESVACCCRDLLVEQHHASKASDLALSWPEAVGHPAELAIATARSPVFGIATTIGDSVALDPLRTDCTAPGGVTRQMIAGRKDCVRGRSGARFCFILAVAQEGNRQAWRSAMSLSRGLSEDDLIDSSSVAVGELDQLGSHVCGHQRHDGIDATAIPELTLRLVPEFVEAIRTTEGAAL